MTKERLSPKIIVPVFIIATVAGLALASVNKLTEEPIKAAIKKELQNALAQVMPGFDNDPTTENQPTKEKEAKLTIYHTKKAGKLIGFAVESTVYTGFSGELGVIFGIDNEGFISKVKILKTMETPGLGTKASEPAFINQFVNKSLKSFNFKVKKDGGDVDAITGATITSRAVTLAVRRGIEGLGNIDLNDCGCTKEENKNE